MGKSTIFGVLVSCVLSGCSAPCMSFNTLFDSAELQEVCPMFLDPKSALALEEAQPAAARAYSALCRRAALYQTFRDLLPKIQHNDPNAIEALRRLCRDDYEVGEVI